MGSCLHTLYAFSDKNLDLTYNRVCWHVDLTVYLMRHLCVILSYIAQYSLLLPLYESSPCFSGSVASQLRIFGKGLYPLLPNTIPAYQLALPLYRGPRRHKTPMVRTWIPFNHDPPAASYLMPPGDQIYYGNSIPIQLVSSRTLLTCIGRTYMRSHIFRSLSMYYKCRSLYIFPKIKGIAQDRI